MLLRTLFVCLLALSSHAQDAGSEAFRRGDYAQAASVWQEQLAQAELPAERARLLYNLGNASYRAGDMHEAVGWYTAALRLAPRDADVWTNLELARVEAGLPPADRGDLKDTMRRALSSLTKAESEWLTFGALLVLAACLAGEALRGSALWRRLALASFCLLALCSLPLFYNVFTSGGEPMLVVAAKGVEGRSEPRPDAKRVAQIEAGAEVERLDQLPGWVKIARGADQVWVRETALFDLRR